MTELATSTTAATELPTGFVNGNGALDPGTRRRSLGPKPQPAERPALPRPPQRSNAEHPVQAGVALGEWQLGHCQRLFDTACRVQEIWREGLNTLAREGVAQLHDAGTQAVAASRELVEAEPGARADLAWAHLGRSLERTLLNAAALQDLLLRPTLQILDLLTRTTVEPEASPSLDRAA